MANDPWKATYGKYLQRYRTQMSVLIAMVLLGCAISAGTILIHGENMFFTANNILKIMHQISYSSIMAVGMTFLILTGQIDLSIAGILAMSCSIAGHLIINKEWDPLWGLLFALALGLLCGCIAGALVTKIRLPSFIATMGLAYIYRGATNVYTGGFSSQGMPSIIKWLGQSYLGPIPVSIIVMLLVFLGSWFLLEKTPLGLQIRAVGGNVRAAKLSGIKTERVVSIVFCISSVLAVLGGFILAGRMNSTSSAMATGVEMDVIASVVIGGTSMSGAEGTIWGTLIGSMLMGILRNGLNLLGIDSFWQQIAMGLVVILAVSIDSMRTRSKDKA